MKLTPSIRTALHRLRRSRIGLRVLAFNLLVLFLPVAGVLYLDVYEGNLLEAQERGMVEQARLVSAALSQLEPGELQLRARTLLGRVDAQGDARIRVVDSEGSLLADSRAIVPPPPANPNIEGSRSRRGRVLYRLGVMLVRVRDQLGSIVTSGRSGGRGAGSGTLDEQAVPPEVGMALQGRYGAATRPTANQRSMTMSSAVPIRRGDQVVGAVVVSQSTFRILQALYSLRLRIFQIVIASMVVAALLSALMSATIVTPLARLRRAASSLAQRRSPLTGVFSVVERRDEIGDLARALEDLAQRLDAQIRLAESFAADVSHEFKNPLASIRTAAEMLVAAEDPAQRERFFSMLRKDVDRLERLVSGVRELARIDARVAQEPAGSVDAVEVLGEMVEGLRSTGEPVTLSVSEGPTFVVRASRDGLGQVFDNIVSNARSFAPGAPLHITVERAGSMCRVSIADSGPGIPPAHLDRVFDRFFTYRPDQPATRREHAGLGLAIARAIVEGSGGSISAANRQEGGACFTVSLPLDKVEARSLKSERSRIQHASIASTHRGAGSHDGHDRAVAAVRRPGSRFHQG